MSPEPSDHPDLPPLGELPDLPERFRPVRWLGRGGTADVLLVEDHARPPAVKALKLLRPDTSRGLVAGFRDEFRILVSLEHPGLGRVYEFGELPGDVGPPRFFYTTEFVEGRELGKALEPGARGVREVCLAAAAVCRTLAYLHARGYVHNDVKPANIIVGPSPDGARLLDFGLAGLDRAQARTVAGTPGYIAPERLSGRPWDGRADLYSVGATLYRVLGGIRLTTTAEPAQALAELVRGSPPLGELRPDLPPALTAMVASALSLEPGGRPRSAAEMVARIGEAIGEDLPLETPGSARCYALSSLFVGRIFEMAELEHAIRGAGQGRAAPRLLAVAAGPGRGKSRLLRELRWRMELEGWRVAGVECAERAGAADPLERLGLQLGAAARPGASVDAPALLAAAPRPTLLMLDDAHRAADVVWRTAFDLARRSSKQSRPALAVLAFDPERLPRTLGGQLELSVATGEALRMELGPIDGRDLRHLLSSLFGKGVLPATVQESIIRQSAGNPLLLEEIVGELVETGGVRAGRHGWVLGEPTTGSARSTRLEDFLRRRYLSLPEDAQWTLALAAALGGRASPRALDAVSRAAGRGTTDVRLGMAQLAERGFVSVEQDELGLQHGALAEVVLAELPPSVRRDLHRAAVGWLSEHGADDAELARAYREAGDPGAAFSHAFAAGRRARAASEARLAVRWLEEALGAASERPQPPEVMGDLQRLLGEVYWMLHRRADTLVALEGALERMPADASRERARLATFAVRVAGAHGDDGAVERWLARARAVGADAPSDGWVAGWIGLSRAHASLSRGEREAARNCLRETLAQVHHGVEPGVPSPRTSLLVTLAGVELFFDVAQARKLASDALAAAEELGDRYLAQLAINHLGTAAVRGGTTDAVALLDQAAADTERSGNFAVLPQILSNLADALHQRGRWEDARAVEARAVAAGEGDAAHPAMRAWPSIFAWREGDAAAGDRAAGVGLAETSVAQDRMPMLVACAWVAAESGAGVGAWALADRGEAEAAVARTARHHALARAIRGYAVATGTPREGGLLLAEAADALAAMGDRDACPPLLRDAALWLGRGGDAEAARGCLERARRIVRDLGSAAGLARLDEIEKSLR